MNKNIRKNVWIIVIAVLIIAVAIYISFFTGNVPAWGYDYCRVDIPCEPTRGDCDWDRDCLTNHCEKGVGKAYGYTKNLDICTCPDGKGWNNSTRVCEPCPAGQIPDSETFVCVPGV